MWASIQDEWLKNFIYESNCIEGIRREVKDKEFEAHKHMLSLGKVKVPDLQWFVNEIQPGAKLRDKPGLNVRVGDYYPPAGGPEIWSSLCKHLEEVAVAKKDDAWRLHCEYETLHPFTDGNGRSGRMLWLWIRRDLGLTFLHRFYYETLSNYKGRA